MEYYYILLAILLAIGFYTDVRTSLLPNWLTMSGVVCGLLFHVIMNGISGLLFSLLGMFVSAGILLLLYVFKALGAGDVKLFAAIGAITGMQFSLYALMYSIIFAGMIGLVLLLVRREFVRRMFYACYRIFNSILSRDMKGLDDFKKFESTRFPFMYAVLPGVLLTVYYFL
ncbi:A24 family peptidase [Bacillus alkalicellulosilyticus]|uniref:A24 family peptidase n=1 Tax=Alkalihalobacterium alkalicellulosilyticum TaxID=1912214 RepID=UPI000997580E|nr:A24 family peptidase [Bacillus alkalicellulosilyticus]